MFESIIDKVFVDFVDFGFSFRPLQKVRGILMSTFIDVNAVSQGGMGDLHSTQGHT